jgi:hypothetical protein
LPELASSFGHGPLTVRDAGKTIQEVAVGLLLVNYIHALLLPGIVITARPGLRAKRRDLFERIHRFGGIPEATPPLRSGAAAQAGEQGGPACPDVLAHDSLGVVAVLGEDQLQDPVMLAVGLQMPARLTQRGRDRP